MNRKFGLFILVLGMTAILTSCWDRHELNEIALAVGMGLDKRDEGVQVSIQIVNPSEVASRKGGGYSPPITVYSATEATTLEAVRKLSTITPREIILSHLRIVVIGEQLAREGITEILDGISRYYQSRSDFNIIIARDTTAEDVLSILTHVEKIPANRMFSTLELSAKLWAPTVIVHLDELVNNIYNPTRDAVLTGIRALGESETGKTLKNLERSRPYTRLQYSGIALFKNDKLVDWLNQDESRGYNFIMDNVQTSVGHVPCPQGGVLAIEIIRSKTKVKANLNRGKPEILIDVLIEGDISEVQCRIDLTKPDKVAMVEKLTEKGVKKVINKAIHKAQENKTDVFGFGDKVEDTSPHTWNKLKDRWDEQFANLDVAVHVDVRIRRLGKINNSLLERKE